MYTIQNISGRVVNLGPVSINPSSLLSFSDSDFASKFSQTALNTAITSGKIEVAYIPPAASSTNVPGPAGNGTAGVINASLISTSTNVTSAMTAEEIFLQSEIGGNVGQFLALAPASGTINFDFSAPLPGKTVANNVWPYSVISMTLNGNATVAVSSVEASPQGFTSGNLYTKRVKLMVHQDATGSRLVTWPASWGWVGGTAPTLTTTANAIDMIDLTIVFKAGTTAAYSVYAVPFLNIKTTGGSTTGL